MQKIARRKTALLCALAVFLTSACGIDGATAPVVPTDPPGRMDEGAGYVVADRHLTLADDGYPVPVEVDDSFAVWLPFDPSLGEAWRLARSDLGLPEPTEYSTSTHTAAPDGLLGPHQVFVFGSAELPLGRYAVEFELVDAAGGVVQRYEARIQVALPLVRVLTEYEAGAAQQLEPGKPFEIELPLADDRGGWFVSALPRPWAAPTVRVGEGAFIGANLAQIFRFETDSVPLGMYELEFTYEGPGDLTDVPTRLRYRLELSAGALP